MHRNTVMAMQTNATVKSSHHILHNFDLITRYLGGMLPNGIQFVTLIHRIFREDLLGVARLLLIAVVLAIGVSFALLNLFANHAVDAAIPKSVVPLMQVTTQTVQYQDHFVTTRRFSGPIEANSSIDVAFEESGRVVVVEAQDGAIVSQGDVLARLDIEMFRADQNSLQELLTEAQAEVTLIEEIVSRHASLRKRNLAQADAFDNAKISLVQARSRKADLQRQLTQLDIRLRRSVLRAPFSGRISHTYVNGGSIVAMHTPIVRLISDGPLEARIGVDTALIKYFRVGDATEVRLREQKIPARVSAILPDVNPVTQTQSILVELDSKTTAALSGAIVSLEMKQMVPETGVTLPLTALRDGVRGLWEVLVAVPDGEKYRVAIEAVQVLHTYNDSVYVRGTFTEGARVITAGQHRVVPGQRVTLAP